MADPTRQPQPLVLGYGWFPDQPGGLTRYLRSLTEALAAENGVPPHVVVIGPVQDAPWHVHAVASVEQPLWRRLASFVRMTRRQAAGAGLVDSHFALYCFPCLALPAVRRMPLVVHFHGPWAEEFVANGAKRGPAITVKRRLETAVYRRAAALVVLSDAFQRVLVEDFGVDPDKVHVLWPGVDLDTFSPGDRAVARAGLGLHDDAWVVVTARRLVPRMGVDVLLQSWARLDDPDRLLVIVGDGEARSELEALANELGVAERVRFAGRVSDADLVEYYRAADLSVVPSTALEGFGLVVLEALACGTPVIGTDVGGLAETIGRLDASLIVPAGDPGALAARLFEARRGAAALPAPRACREFAEGHSWSAVARRHLELYQRVIDAT